MTIIFPRTTGQILQDARVQAISDCLQKYPKLYIRAFAREVQL